MLYETVAGSLMMGTTESPLTPGSSVDSSKEPHKEALSTIKCG
jgi:hypothetical protein